MTSLKTHIINERIIEEVKSSIKEKKSRFLIRLIDEMRAADLADLIEHLNPEERLYLFEMLNLHKDIRKAL